MTTPYNKNLAFNSIQDGGYIFSAVTFPNLGVRPSKFLAFSLNPFDTMLKNLNTIPSISPKFLNLTQDKPSKRPVFLVRSLYKVEVMISSLFQMLELPDFGHMTTPAI